MKDSRSRLQLFISHFFVKRPCCARNAREGGAERRDGCGEGGRKTGITPALCRDRSVRAEAALRSSKECFSHQQRRQRGTGCPQWCDEVSVHSGCARHWRGFSVHHTARELRRGFHGSGRKWRELELSMGGVGIALAHLAGPGHGRALSLDYCELKAESLSPI